MKKRFIDCDKFDDPWFRKLSPDHKVLWDFITCKCDNSGVWKIDFELARFMTGCFELSEENALRAFNDGKERVVCFKPRYWFIVGFVDFQFGGYDGNNNFHKQIRGLLEKHGLSEFQGQTRGCLAPLEKDKEEVKEKEKGIVKGGRFSPPSLEELKAAFSEKGFAPSEADKFMAYFTSVGWVVGKSQKPMKNWRGAVATWCGNLREKTPGIVKREKVLVPEKDCAYCQGTGYGAHNLKCQWCWK